MKELKILLIISLSVLSQMLEARDAVHTDSSAFYPRITYAPYSGYLLGRAPEISRLQGIPYLGQELLLGFQASHTSTSYQALNAPYYGLGLHYGMYQGTEVGDVFSGFLFFDLPLWRNGKSSISTMAAMGLALHCNQYDFADEPDFMETSSYANVYSHISLSYHYQLSSQFDLGIGGRFQHFSNGGWQYPNHGMEMASAQLSISYTADSKPIWKKNQGVEEKKHAWIPLVSFGLSGSERDFETQYWYTNLSLAYSVVRRPFYALGFGVDVAYNAALEERFAGEFNTIDAIYSGVFVSNELLFRDVRFGLQVGVHAFDNVDFSLPVYERLILRYHYVPQSFLHFGIRMNGGKSECLEWGIGFVL